MLQLCSRPTKLREMFIELLAGVDGTLQLRMRSTPAEGRLTGLMAGVRTIAGFTVTQGDEAVVFSIM
ncbi:D-alanyl-D-alanine carboxypeptidase [Candidatus Magnetominusculus xianensis]|nr:D-alanyl-D-alanine carboxypeptidase [Candidatus Magnetominusculus xianensis]